MVANSIFKQQFPLLTNFEDLPQIINLKIPNCVEPTPNAIIYALQRFLSDKENGIKLCTENLNEGYSFVEAAYVALQWSKSTSKALTINVLSSFFTALLQSARRAVDSLLSHKEDSEILKSNQNTLRVCIFFLCHGMSITEACCIEDSATNSRGVKSVKPLNVLGDRKWNELKASVILGLYSILKAMDSVFTQHQEKKAAEELIQAAAISCLIHQKWSDRNAEARANLQKIRAGLMNLISDTFLNTSRFTLQIAHETLDVLLKLCRNNKDALTFQVDLISYVLGINKLAGISMLTHIVNRISQKSHTLSGEERILTLDENETAMAILADFATRKDAIIIVGLYLARLVPALQNERAAVRKYLFDIVGGCLQKANMLSCDHLSAFIKLFSVFLRDRDATCRLRALTCLGADFKWILFCRQDSLIDLLSLISQRCLDRSKSIRIKAMQSLAGLFSETNKTTITPDRRRVNMMDIGSEVISIAFKLLALSPDSMYYCNDTIEAAGNFLCSTALRGQAMHEHLKSSLDYSYGAFSQKIFSDVIHFHLVGYKEWSEFSATASDATLLKLINFLSMEPDQERLHKKKYQGVLKEAFNALETSRRQKELVACILIAVFSPLTSYNVGNEWNLLLDTIQESVAGTTPCEADQISKTRLIKWSLKALAAVVRNRKTHKNKQVKLLLERHYVSLNEADADSAIECLYSLNNTFEIVKSVLHVYEIQLQILDRSHPLKLLRNYIIFIGNISRNYDLACDAFIQRLRDAQASMAREYVTAEFDYLQQEEQKLQEEDAVLRFSNMLLDGDSVPGCYVPFLQQLSTSETLHTSLRTAAITSLGKYLFASARLANENKHLLEGLMQSTHIPVKLAALDLIQKLILAFPNDFLCMLSRVILTLQDEEVKEAAYCICARLLLEQKLKPDVLLGPICDGLCETNVKIRTVLIFVLKKLLEDAGRSKHQLILSLYKYGASAQARQKLVEVLVEELLDAADLQSDELASSVVHALTLGQHDATFLASFLNPSSKVLAALEINLTTCPPRIFLQGNPEATSNLIKFVNNHKRQSSRHAASDRQLVARLLELLQNKASMRKRKSQDKAASLAISLENIKDYEHAVEDFKNCRIGNSLWEMMKSDI